MELEVLRQAAEFGLPKPTSLDEGGHTTTPRPHYYPQHISHHNGLPKLLVRAYLRHKNGCPIPAHPARLCDRARRSPANRNTLKPDRATRANTSPTHHQVKDPTPPFKPERAPSTSTPQQCHPPPRSPIRPPCGRSTRMADVQLQLQQSLRQDPADRFPDHGRPAVSVR
jgi:hypothetical protein